MTAFVQRNTKPQSGPRQPGFSNPNTELSEGGVRVGTNNGEKKTKRKTKMSRAISNAGCVVADTLKAQSGEVENTDIGFTRYRRINVRKSETSDLRASPQDCATNYRFIAGEGCGANVA
jgi:hypothetical protein